MTVKLDDLPPSVRIGPHDIEIGFFDGKTARKEFGAFQNADAKILLCKEYALGSQAVDTLLHEICHAAFWTAGVNFKHEFEEPLCGMLGMMLTQIIRDNPELVKWMQATVTK